MPSTQARQTCTVALLADVPSTGHLGAAQARRFSLSGNDSDERYGAFVTYAQEQAQAGQRIVALYPRWRAQHPQRAIGYARGSLRDDLVADVGLDLPPLALSLLADQLTYLAPYLPPGLVAELPRHLTPHMLGGAWLGRVNNLAALPVSFRQHLQSYLPKTSFLALSLPEHSITALPGRSHAFTLPARPEAPVQMLVSAPENTNTEQFSARLTPRLGQVSSRTLPEQPLSQAYWGCKRYVEFVAFSAHPQALTQAVYAIRAVKCQWCREPVAEQVCRFCAARNLVSAGRLPADPRASQLPSPVQESGTDTSMAESQRCDTTEPGDAPPTTTTPNAPVATASSGSAPPTVPASSNGQHAETVAPGGAFRSQPLAPDSPAAPASPEHRNGDA